MNSFPCSLDWFIFNNSFFNLFRNIFNLSFYSIIVSNSSFNRDFLCVDNLLIFYNLSFIWNSFNPFNSIILNIFFFERNILNSWFDWDLFSNNFMCSSWYSSISGSTSVSSSSIAGGDWSWNICSSISSNITWAGSICTSSRDIGGSSNWCSYSICGSSWCSDICCSWAINSISSSRPRCSIILSGCVALTSSTSWDSSCVVCGHFNRISN